MALAAHRPAVSVDAKEVSTMPVGLLDQKRYKDKKRTCPRCGRTYPAIEEVCPSCGTYNDMVLPPPRMRRVYARCPRCREQYLVTEPRCPACGLNHGSSKDYRRCPRCGSDYEVSTARYCPSCFLDRKFM